MELVVLRNNEAVCDSTVVAKQFGMKHNKVSDAIERVFDDYPDLRGNSSTPKSTEKCWPEERNYRGRDYIAYIMNREFFSLLMMRFTTPTAREWQRTFNAAFYSMENALLKADDNSKNPEWIKLRTQSKQIRLQQTDVIKEFVDYAINQGSKNARHYYKHYTNATYKALQLIQHKKPKLKDTLDILELSQLMVAENLAKKSIRKHMEEGEHYKVVFELVKQDLINFADGLFLTAE